MGAPLVIDGSEKTTVHGSYLSGNVTIASLEVVECLFDKINSQGSSFIDVLKFIKENTENNAVLSNKMDFEMSFNYTQKAVRCGQVTKYVQPRTSFK